MNQAGFFTQRPMVGLQGSSHGNRSAIAGLMGAQGNPFGFAGGANPFGMQPPPSQPPMGPPGGGQMPIPPSLNFTPGVGTSSPAMTDWRPPQYPQAAPSNQVSYPSLGARTR